MITYPFSFFSTIHFCALVPLDKYCWILRLFSAIPEDTSNTLPEFAFVNVTYPVESWVTINSFELDDLSKFSCTFPLSAFESFFMSNTKLLFNVEEIV